MAKQAVKVELFYDAAWRDVTALDEVYTRDPVTIRHGRGNEQAAAAASSATFTLKNTGGKYNPRNPSSPLYGKIGRNTPARVSVGADIRFAGEVAKWAPGRAIDDGDAWVQMTANGVSRRLAQGASPLRSSLYRYITANNPVAYWPLDAGRLGSTGHSPTGAPDATLAPATDRVSALGFGMQAAEVDTLQSTSSATFTDLTTVGPEVTVVIGQSGRAVALWGAFINPSATGTGGQAGIAVSGATTIAASTGRVLSIQEGTTAVQMGASYIQTFTGLNPGQNTFTLKYRRIGGANNVSFSDRTLVVIPF